VIHNETFDHSFQLAATSRRIFEALWGRDALAEHPSLRSARGFEYLLVHAEPGAIRGFAKPADGLDRRQSEPADDRRANARRLNTPRHNNRRTT
jgi:hypothetical protein